MSRILIQDEKRSVLLADVILAESIAARMRGLLGSSSLPEGTGLLIRPCRSIHMWFMKFPIDAVFLNKDLRVLRISHNLHPWKLAFAPPKTHCVLEGPAGSFSKLKPGIKLSLET